MEVFLSEAALHALRSLRAADRALLREGMAWHLVEADPRQASRNKFRLRRASEHAEYELRLGAWRVFYRIRAERVEVALIGKKMGERLLVGGEEFEL